MANHVDTLHIDNEGDKAIYEHLLDQDEEKIIKIYKEEFTFAKNGRETNPIITVWYRDKEE